MNPTPLKDRRVLPASSPKVRLRNVAEGRLDESDIRCLMMMIDQGTCFVLQDRDTREILIQGVGPGIRFVDSVMKRD